MTSLRDAKEIISNAITNNPKHIKKGLMPLCVMLWGAPGIGKTAIVDEVSEETDSDLNPVILAQWDAGELGGFPMLINKDEDKIMVKARPDYFPTNESKKTVLFLDELPQAPIANQNIAAQLTYERRLGNHFLHDNVTVICAGNDPKHRAGTNIMPTHLKNRIMHLDIQVDTNEALDHFSTKQLAPELIGFIRWRPEFLHKFDSDVKAFPSPRAWEMVNSILNWKMTKNAENAAIAGLVGQSAAQDFRGFLDVYRSLPDPDAPFNSPQYAPIPNDPSVLYAVMASLSHRVVERTAGNLMKYLDRIDSMEFVAACVKDFIKRKPELHKNKIVTDWMRNKGRLIFT